VEPNLKLKTVDFSETLLNFYRFVRMHTPKQEAFLSAVIVTSDFSYCLSISRNSCYTILDTSCRVKLVMYVCVAQDCEVPLV
jgi:hypothetical protein